MSTSTTNRMDVERLLSPCGPISKESGACAAAAERLARERRTWVDDLAGMSG
jgi:hypothetical protein